MNAMAYLAKKVTSPFTRRKTIPKVTVRVLEVVEFVRQHPGATRSMVAERFNCARNTANIHLQAARLNGLIRVDFKGRFSRWYFVEPQCQTSSEASQT